MLEITNASCGYKNKHHIRYVIKNLDFNLSPGEILCMLGSNGIGKTTLFRSVLGSLKLLGGDIKIDGTSVLTMVNSFFDSQRTSFGFKNIHKRTYLFYN